MPCAAISFASNRRNQICGDLQDIFKNHRNNNMVDFSLYCFCLVHQNLRLTKRCRAPLPNISVSPILQI